VATSPPELTQCLGAISEIEGRDIHGRAIYRRGSPARNRAPGTCRAKGDCRAEPGPVTVAAPASGEARSSEDM
jgi:hypothetical protein